MNKLTDECVAVTANAAGRLRAAFLWLEQKLCVYGRWIYAPEAHGAHLLVVLLFVCYWTCISASFLSLFTVYFYKYHLIAQAHSWEYSDLRLGTAFCQIISRCCGRHLFGNVKLLQNICVYLCELWVC